MGVKLRPNSDDEEIEIELEDLESIQPVLGQILSMSEQAEDHVGDIILELLGYVARLRTLIEEASPDEFKVFNTRLRRLKQDVQALPLEPVRAPRKIGFSTKINKAGSAKKSLRKGKRK